jgi:myo-inositol 2-dehydrogenase / D-chiro-inositol 1-dehydrogenase
LAKINLGIIGLGNQGKNHLLNCLRLKEANVIGVADVSERALHFASRLGVKNVYQDYNKMLENKLIDAVIINLPNFLHKEGSVRAAEAGKDILLEKPLARTVQEGQEILSAVKKNNVQLMIGYDLRFNTMAIDIHDKIVGGFFGDVKIADATNISGGPFSPRNDRVGPVQVPSWWFSKEQSGGGALIDLGSHMIDLLSWYFGEVVSVQSYLEHNFHMESEDAATCVLRFKEGPVATIKVGWFSKDFLQSIQIFGTAKNIMVQIAPERTLQRVQKGISKKIGFGQNDSIYSELEYFVKCLQQNKTPNPTGEDGLRCLQVISSSYENNLNKK